jgi:two-component system chemotaxis sensor kinase CheA
LVSLHKVFGIEPRFTNPCLGIVVILEVDGKRAALFVDELVGQQQVVVKNIESNYKKVLGVSGATILGDGGVALILDVSAILRT